MSVQEKIPYVSYIANGSTVKFNIPFDLHNAGYLVVTVDKMIPAVGGYIVNLNDMSITFVTAPRSGAQVELYRDTKLKRDTNYQSYDNSFRPSSVNFDFDSIWQALQDQHMVDARIAARIREEIEQRRVADGLMQGQIEILNQVILSVFNDASSEYVANKLTELDSLIQTAAAAAAGANGWIADLVVDGNENQHQINKSLIRTYNSVSDLLLIPNPRHGQVAFVRHYDLDQGILGGGGTFVFDSTKSVINDGGVTVSGWVRQSVTKEIDPVIFGAKVNFTEPVNAADANDDRLAIQRAIDYLAENGGGEVTFNSGKYWVNSYTESPLSAEPTYDIIMMRPNVSFSWSGGSQIIVGNFFHDKKFHLFSGYLVGGTLLNNVHFKRPYITSILAENYKVTASHRRVVIEFRNCDNVSVKDGVVRDIELSNCIGAGVSEGSRKGKNAHVSGMLFLNLTKSGNLANIDHTTVYLNAENSTVSNCSFIDTGTRGWEISCPVELHASNTSFTDSYVYGYTRGGWFVSELVDGTTRNQKIANNSGIVAHTVAQVWSVDDSTLQNCLLVDNDFELRQPSGGTPANFGNQALISTSGNAIGLRGVLSGLTVKGNNVRYIQAYNESFKRVFDFDNPAVFVNTTIKDNIFYGVNGGGVANLGTLDGFYLSENHFITTGVVSSATNGFISIKANSVGSLSTRNNKFTFRAGRVEAAIKLQYTNANRLDLGECEYTDTYSVPVVSDYYFPDGFSTLQESKLNNTWYNVPLSIPAIAANQSALVGVSMPTPTKGIPFVSKSYFTGNFGYPVLVHDGLSCGTNLSSINMYLTNVLPTEYAARNINVDCKIIGGT